MCNKIENQQIGRMKKLLLIILATLSIQKLQGQDLKELIGLIEDENGEPLIGVNIVNYKDENRFGGTCTDKNGIYELSTNADSVEISYLGYETIKLSIQALEQDPFIVMKNTSIGLPELVVTGFAIQQGKPRWCGNRSVVSDGIMEGQVNESQIEYKIYPNPSLNIVTIDISRRNEGQITLITSNGIELYTEKIKRSKLQLDLARYPSGSYYIKYEEQEIIKILGPIIKVSN